MYPIIRYLGFGNSNYSTGLSKYMIIRYLDPWGRESDLVQQPQNRHSGPSALNSIVFSIFVSSPLCYSTLSPTY